MHWSERESMYVWHQLAWARLVMGTTGKIAAAHRPVCLVGNRDHGFKHTQTLALYLTRNTEEKNLEKMMYICIDVYKMAASH